VTNSPFAHHFRQCVIPRLQRLATAEAFCVVRGAEDWSGAFDSLMAYAKRYGALHLAPDTFADLDDWLSATLLQEIDQQEALLATGAGTHGT
jgi:hypothetical protein